MIKLTVLTLSLVSASTGMSMIAKSSKTMTVLGPNGSEKMFVERSASSDLDSSASGYIYQSNGNQPATIVRLGEPGYREPIEFTHLMGHSIDPYPTGFDRFGHGKGTDRETVRWNAHGEKGVKGYSGYDHYDEGGGKKYEGKHDSGYYNEREGEKSSRSDEGGSYGSFDAGEKGESGESFEKKSSHKKGHKTTGYHNVYHKDEFKKQHSFYDESDGSGRYNKHEKSGESYSAEKGGHRNGDHSDSGYRLADYGKKGGFDKGSSSDGSKGFHEIEGGNSHFSKNSRFGKIGGKSFRKDYGFQDDSGFDRER